MRGHSNKSLLIRVIAFPTGEQPLKGEEKHEEIKGNSAQN
jgi:hypothetical protein